MARASSVRGSVVVLGVFECRTEVDAPRGQPVRVVVGEVDVVRLHEELVVATDLLHEGLVALHGVGIGAQPLVDLLRVRLPGAHELAQQRESALLARLLLETLGVCHAVRLGLVCEGDAAERGGKRLELAAQQDHLVRDDECTQLEKELSFQLAERLVGLLELRRGLRHLLVVLELEHGSLSAHVEVLLERLTDRLHDARELLVGRVGHDDHLILCRYVLLL